MEASDVLSFWFELDRERWFEKNDALDDEVRRRFLALHEEACRGGLEHWKQHPRGCLALVIIFDQFPRNMFRGAAEAFASDERARACARLIVANGWDEAMTHDERTFAYLPFEHSEAIEDQELSMRLYEGNENYEWARKHWEIIRRFGRFPHRNAALGRVCTLEEAEFLEQPESGF
jgi:uncharacterized protein (DUF924 family)